MALHHTLRAGDYAAASKTIEATIRKWYAFRCKIGAKTSGESSVVKAALELVGRPGGVEREPTRSLMPAEREELRKLLIEIGVPHVRGAAD